MVAYKYQNRYSHTHDRIHPYMLVYVNYGRKTLKVLSAEF